jgi:hypothetical protein
MCRDRAQQTDADDAAHRYSAARTAALVLVALAFAWAYLLAGFLPEPAGGAWRRYLLRNPANPSIGMAFMIPATAVPILLAFRHGRSGAALGAIVAASYLLAVGTEWMMRRAVRTWAPLELPPFDMPLWSAHNLVSLLIVVTVATLVAAGWRRGMDSPKPVTHPPAA